MNFDFALLLVLLTFGSGLIWLVDALMFAPNRRRARAGDGEQQAADPKLVEYAKSFFPIFLVVLLLRSFLVEPFRIPSGSMMPTLLIGDFILVNKFTYGIRLPVLNKVVIDGGSPQRGDVVVFRYPKDPTTPFIKRVIGVPGDLVVYRDKRLFINGTPMEYNDAGVYQDQASGRDSSGYRILNEQLGDVDHSILVAPRPDMGLTGDFRVRVPADSYFVLGDNRDQSKDSRFWGFVPDENLIGKAFYVWFSFDWARKGWLGWDRIGNPVE